jgi:glucose 1-dehydrogenase
VFPQERAVRVVDHARPALEDPRSVRLRVLEVGVCGTDREICSFQYGTPPAGSPYLVLGHESLGEVTEVGPAVEHLAPGDLVVPMVRRPCPSPDCPACRSDRQDFCYTGLFTERGINGAHGYMTGEVVDEERWMVPVPAHLRDCGVLIEPLTIVEKALLQVWAIQDRMPWVLRHGGACGRGGSMHRALVLGAGPVGLLGALALRAAGFETHVYSRGMDEARRALIAGTGAMAIPAESVPIDALPGALGRIDLVYEATGASSLAFAAMDVLGTNGIFVLTGVPGRHGPVPVEADRLMRDLVLRNQIVLGTVNAGRDAYEAAVLDLAGFVSRWPDAVRGLITARLDLEAAPGALGRAPGGIKTVIRVGA